MKVLISICGREGSKGVKNKNIREFLGYPLIYYTIAAVELLKEKRRDIEIDTCINSDGDKILDVCKKFKEYVSIKRPKELATDSSAKLPAIIYSLKYMENLKNKKYDYVIDLDITSPLRKVEDIENSLKKILETKKEVVFSVVDSRRNPYFNMVEKIEDQVILSKEANFLRRQDVPKVYDMNASIYCYNRNSLVESPKDSPLKYESEIIEMEDAGIIDIDSEKDFILLEILIKYYFKEKYIELFDKIKLF